MSELITQCIKRNFMRFFMSIDRTFLTHRPTGRLHSKKQQIPETKSSESTLNTNQPNQIEATTEDRNTISSSTIYWWEINNSRNGTRWNSERNAIVTKREKQTSNYFQKRKETKEQNIENKCVMRIMHQSNREWKWISDAGKPEQCVRDRLHRLNIALERIVCSTFVRD